MNLFTILNIDIVIICAIFKNNFIRLFDCYNPFMLFYLKIHYLADILLYIYLFFLFFLKYNIRFVISKAKKTGVALY